MGIKFDEKQIYNLQVSRIKDINKRLAELFKDSRDKALAELLKYRASVTSGGIIKRSKEERLVNLIREINKEIGDLTGKSYKVIETGYYNTFESTYYLKAWALEKSINTELGLNYFLKMPKLNEKVIQASFDKRIGGLLLKDRTNRIKNTLQYLVQDAIGQNVIEGQSVNKLNKNLKLINEAMNAGFKNTQRIARTELLKAYSLGNDESRIEAENSGVEFEYLWSAALDQKTRPDHAAADNTPPNKMVDNDPVWTIGGVDLKAPRIPLVETGSNAEAAQVVECRCSRLDLPSGIRPTKRTAKTKEGKWVEVNGDLTAKEWIEKEYNVKVGPLGKWVDKDSRPVSFKMDTDKMRRVKLPDDVKKAGIDSKKYQDWIYKNWT